MSLIVLLYVLVLFAFLSFQCLRINFPSLLASIHNRGIIGHIEEVVVSKDLQGTGLGIKLIRAVDSIAVSVGCYRTTLGCSERNVGFYAKCGYEKAGTEMSHYYEPFTEPYKRG